MNLKHAIRSLRKSPLVTAAAILSLALGIGANTAIFSIFHQVLLRELPVNEPGRLVNLSSPGPIQGSSWHGVLGDCPCVFSYPMFKDLERNQNVFTGIAAHVNFDGNLSYNGRTEGIQGIAVSGSYFPILGLQPALGRLFVPADDGAVDEPHAVVLSYDYWTERFGSDPRILDQNLTLNGQPMTIVGVAPRSFRGTTVGRDWQVFIPLTMARYASSDFRSFDDRKQYLLYLFARLKPGVSVEQATAAINAPYHNVINEVEAPLQKMSAKSLERFKAKQIRLEDGSRGQSQVAEDIRTPLLLMAGVTVFVLLIACSNIANLLLARGTARSGEMAVRLSIGATRRQLIGQLLLESCLLATLGGIAGLVVAQWTLALISSLIPPGEAVLEYGLNPAAILFTATLAIGTGILFGLFPALQTTRPDVQSALKGQAGQPGGSRVMSRFRTTLTTAQIALSMALLIMSGLFIKSLMNISRQNLGVRTDHVVTFSVSPGLNGYSPKRISDFLEQTEDAVTSLPGVTGVTVSTVPLFSGTSRGNTLQVEGFQSGPDIDSNAHYTFIDENYFRTLGIPLISGREFTRADVSNGPKVAIVNEAFANKFNFGRTAVGKRMGLAMHEPDTEIVGIVPDSKYSDVKERPRPMYFLPYRQAGAQDGILDDVSFYVRTSLDPNQLLRIIPSAVSKIDTGVPVERAWTLPEQIQQNVMIDRVISTLSSLFAGVATILAAVGLYGMLSYVVAQRTKEIGIRVALGADPAKVHMMVFRYVGFMTLIGGAIGVTTAIGAGRFAETMLFQLNGHDPAVLVIATMLLAGIALGAGFIPARRAANVDPIKALRYE